ncbi:hypothetical protein ABMA28_011891 [Loxostege sticticalis]|uniref:Uncharacterized protein n=1 Tax=Loxostege sticticalis TaxID=481309 RepID=A0ABD0TKV8_LOXSC
MERICCLQEQFDRDFTKLPDPERSSESLNSDLEEFSNRDGGLKMSFLRLCRLMHVTMLLSLVYFCNICLWFIMTKKNSPRTLRYTFKVSIPST